MTYTTRMKKEARSWHKESTYCQSNSHETFSRGWIFSLILHPPHWQQRWWRQVQGGRGHRLAEGGQSRASTSQPRRNSKQKAPTTENTTKFDPFCEDTRGISTELTGRCLVRSNGNLLIGQAWFRQVEIKGTSGRLQFQWKCRNVDSRSSIHSKTKSWSQ